MSWKITLPVCAVILLSAAGATTVIFSTEPAAERVSATKETAMLVEVVEVRRGTHRPTISGMGTVRPAREVLLAPRVAGEIVDRSPAFTPGGFVHQGEMLLRIDPEDYENALAQRKSELAEAEADLAIERGQQDLAKRGYRLLGRDVAPENEALVLREPQLATAKARIDGARAAVRTAELELERTRIEAPFDAHVLTREADVGSQVAPGEALGRLVGLDAYWVVATVPLSKLRWLRIPDDPDDRGSLARVHDPAAWADGEHRTGRVDRLIGALDERTRMARVLVTIEDPLARRSDAAEDPALMIGSFVDVHFEGRELVDVVRLDRDLVRKDDTVWVMEEGVLRVRPVAVRLTDARYAYVSEGLSGGDRVVTTDLSTVVDGAALRVEDDPEEQGSVEERSGGSPEASR